MTAQQAFQSGQLAEALALATQAVKSKPTDTDARSFLGVLLCFAGEWERADTQFNTLAMQRSDLAIGISLARQLIRAEQARADFYTQGRLPEILLEPSPVLRVALEASIEIRDGKLSEAAQLLQAAEDGRSPVSLIVNDQVVDDVREGDDLLSGALEVLTSNGKYYWIPFTAIESMEFEPPKQPLDLLWREARLSVANGPDGKVYVPVTYWGSSTSGDNQLALGRATDWRGGENSPVRGIGQREFLVGEEALGIMEIRSIKAVPGTENVA